MTDKTKATFRKTPYVNPSAGSNPRWLNAPHGTEPDTEEFAAQQAEVLEVSTQVSRGEWPVAFLSRHGLTTHPPEPLWSEVMTDGKRDAHKAAQLVRMDHPLALGIAIREWLASQGVRYRHHSTAEDAVDFVFGVVWFDAMVLWSVFRALVVVFGLKWLWWIRRPEEEYECNITQYSEGCPGHPGDPAGHGAAAGATCRRIILLLQGLLTESTTRTVVMTGLHFATYRTFAGVHRAEENFRGFVIGWASVRRDSYSDARAQILEIVPTLAI